MNNIMIDLETLGTIPSAAILSIGAVAFDLEKQQIGETFQVYVSLGDNLRLGRTISESTMKFWLEQPEDIRSKTFSGTFDLKTALHSFNSFYMWNSWGGRKADVWGNGAAFDNVLMEDAYRCIGEHPPWKYKNNMCFRTMREWFGIEKEGVTTHVAVEDAIQQVEMLFKIQAICPRVLRGEGK